MKVEPRPAALRPYVPRLVVEWARSRPDAHFLVVPGSLLSLDVSGFTSLSERLQAKGRSGAEELILLISGVFEGLIGIAHRRGGDVLKFRGDALLLFFSGPGHEERACRAASEMQWLLEQTAETMSSVGPVRLRMATGVHSGDVQFYLVGTTHRELVVTGPAASAVVELESAAAAGEILVSAATADVLEPRWLVGERNGAQLVHIDAGAGESEGASGVVEQAAVDAPLVDDFVSLPLRAHLAVAAGEGEHRTVTAAFLKFSGTDGLLERDGPEAVLAELKALGESVGNACSDLGVTWLESDVDVDGGKLYLVAGAPSSAGDDEERMLRALRRILDAGPGATVRAGVNRGPAFAGDVGAAARRTYAVMGDTVNLAARLTARAGQGQVLASAGVLERARTRFATSHQPFLMKGKERPVTAYSVGPPVGVRDEPVDTTLPLAGRERELELFNEALNGARMRQPRFVELVGEPGLGKSRLVEELKARALGFQQLVTRCEPYEAATPYFAFRSLVRPLAGLTPEQSSAEAGAQLAPWVSAVMPDLAPWLPLLAIPFDAEVEPTEEAAAIDASFRRDKLHEVVDQFLTRVLLMPTLIAVEDTHWIDDASAFLLRHLASSPMPRPWFVCVTRRPEGAAVFPPERSSTIRLEPLPMETATALALAAAHDVALAAPQLEALMERAGGNPLFVRELVAAARSGQLETLPESVETLMTSRIDLLEPDDRLLLRYAAVVGPSFDVHLLEEILANQPVEAGDLARWERLAEFVTWETGETVRFRHDLFRVAAYEGLSFRRRREIHARVGEALERRSGEATEEVAGPLSLHFLEAGSYDKAWRYATAAGRRAQAMFANVVAAELYERAVAAAAELPDLANAEVAAVQEALGDVTTLFADYERAARAYEHALDLSGSDTVARTRLMRKIGLTVERLGRPDDGIRWYERALEELEAVELGVEGLANRVELEIAYAGSLYYQSRYDECIRWAQQAAEHAEDLPDKSPLAHASYVLSLASSQAGRPEPRYHERAIAIYEETGELVGYGRLLNNLGLQAYERYSWDEALQHYARGAEMSERAGDVTTLARIRVNEADVLADRGQLADAEARLVDVMRVWRAAKDTLAIAITSSNLGRIVGRAGRFDEGRRLLEDARAAFFELGNPLWAAEASIRIAETHVLAGEYQEGLAAATAALEEAREVDAPRVLVAMLERLIAYALVQARRKDDALPHFERSLELARDAGADYEVALTLKAMADTEFAGDDAARESGEILERLGVVALPRVPLP